MKVLPSHPSGAISSTRISAQPAKGIHAPSRQRSLALCGPMACQPQLTAISVSEGWCARGRATKVASSDSKEFRPEHPGFVSLRLSSASVPCGHAAY